MSDIAKRLRASVKYDAINGTVHERAICGRQMLAAAAEIERLQAENEELRRKVEAGDALARSVNEALNMGDGSYHLLGPSGYLERIEWAEEMRKTHRQERCPGCGLWVIWRPKAGHSCMNQENSHADPN